MPAKGKHRRPKSQRLTRSIAAAGTGGAALALPLLGATGAHAAPTQSASASVPEQAVAKTVERSVEKAAQTAQAAPVAHKSGAKHSTYTVRSGDYLSRIADEQGVDGGWQRLYQDNRRAVGDNPSLIHPGLKLSIGKKAASSAPTSAPTAAPRPSEARGSARSAEPVQPSKPARKSQPAQSSSSAGSSDSQASTSQPDTQAAENSSTASSGFSLPVAGATVGTPYRMSGSMWSSGYHTGVDFVVPTGTSLKAVAAGTVVSAGWGGAYGNQVVIKLNDGHYAQYAHLSSLSVSAGQTVTAGQQVGLSGATGNVTGPHLHFEIRTTPNYGSDVDPVAYLRSHGVSVG
ncbi:M23 family metallopeptidase [Streptomyces antibioticus]|uniref:M23 family metallopeptidase n=1 Tax=Streptomyces antibioticus TaxID=1890 RepID=UPI0033FE9BF2